MRREWTVCYSVGQLWEPDHHGIFVERGSDLLFLFMQHLHLYYFSVRDNCIGEVPTFDCLKNPILAQNWTLVKKPFEHIILNENCALNLQTLETYSDLSELDCRAFQEHKDSLKELTEKDIVFGDFTIHHEGAFGFSCYHKGERRWKINCQGYLYTPMELYKERFLMFGTAGYGGRFYNVDIENGEKLSEIKTNGTTHYIKDGDARLMLVLGKKAGVIHYLCTSGEVTETISVPGIVQSDCLIYKYKDKLFVTSFEYKKGEACRALMTCITV